MIGFASTSLIISNKTKITILGVRNKVFQPVFPPCPGLGLYVLVCYTNVKYGTWTSVD